MATTKQYAVLSASEISKINFSNFSQTIDTVRYTADGNFFIVKYNSDLPIDPLQYTTPVLSGATLSQAITTVSTTDWDTFNPLDLPNLDIWLDAREGVFSSRGNYFTDETASILLSGFPVDVEGADPNITLDTYSKFNNKNRYSSFNVSGGLGGNVNIIWDRDKWKMTFVVYAEESEFKYYFYSNDNTQYPWQADWGSGRVIIRTPTTFDVPATSGQQVNFWYNKIFDNNIVLTTTTAKKPIYNTDVYSRPAVSIDHLANIFISNKRSFSDYFSYYIVTTSILSSSEVDPPPPYFNNLISIGAPLGNLFSFVKGALGINTDPSEYGGNNLSFTSGSSTTTLSSLNGLTNEAGAVFSVRANLENGADTATIGKNLSAQTIEVTSTVRPVNVSLRIGSSLNNFRGAKTNVIEVLVFREYHDANTAQQIIKYLASKNKINLNI